MRMKKTTATTTYPKARVFNTIPAATTTRRVCSHCETTKTPLWRSGPMGPKVIS